MLRIFPMSKRLFSLRDIKKILGRLPATIRESLHALIKFTISQKYILRLSLLTLYSL